MAEAFALAANNLIASTDFLKMVERSSGLMKAPDSSLGQMIDNKKENYITLEATIAAAKNSTITVRTAAGHGSGFAVGDGSFIFTNAHVVGNAKNVALVTDGGISIEGEVEKVSKERDVALIKMIALRLNALHISTQLPATGSTVYAIGSPFTEQLSGSVTEAL